MQSGSRKNRSPISPSVEREESFSFSLGARQRRKEEHGCKLELPTKRNMEHVRKLEPEMEGANEPNAAGKFQIL